MGSFTAYILDSGALLKLVRSVLKKASVNSNNMKNISH